MNEDEKQCQYCAELIKLAAVKCKHCGSDLLAVSNSARGHKNKSSLSITVSILLLLAISAGASFASPYLTVNNLRENLQKKNTRELASLIDFAAIRENLKAQFMKQAVEKAANDPSTKTGFGALGFMLGAAMISGFVDVFVSPAVT